LKTLKEEKVNSELSGQSTTMRMMGGKKCFLWEITSNRTKALDSIKRLKNITESSGASGQSARITAMHSHGKKTYLIWDCFK